MKQLSKPMSSRNSSQSKSLSPIRASNSTQTGLPSHSLSNLTNNSLPLDNQSSSNPFDMSQEDDSDSEIIFSNSPLPNTNSISDTYSFNTSFASLNSILPDSSIMTSDERAQVKALVQSRFLARFIDLQDRVEDLFR